MLKFSELIKTRREEMNLSVRALEKLLKEQEGIDLSKTFVNFIENERKKPTYEVAYALAKVLEIDVEEAIRAAYIARVEFNKERELTSLNRFISDNKLNYLDVDRIMML